MSELRLCRVIVDLGAGAGAAADLYPNGDVAVLLWYPETAMWGEIGRGKLVDGQIFGMPGREDIGRKAYGALEGALAGFLKNPLF